MPQLIPTMHELAPRMPLLAEEHYTAVPSEKLRHSELDVIIIALPFDEPGVVTQALYNEPFLLLLPSSHPLALEAAIATDQLEEETVLLLGQGHCFRDQVLEACPTCAPRAEDKPCLQKTLEGASLETIRMMVTSGVGITVLPCTAAGAERYSERLLTIRRFRDIQPGRTVALAWRSSFPRTASINIVKQAIADSTLRCITKHIGE